MCSWKCVLILSRHQSPINSAKNYNGCISGIEVGRYSANILEAFVASLKFSLIQPEIDFKLSITIYE